MHSLSIQCILIDDLRNPSYDFVHLFVSIRTVRHSDTSVTTGIHQGRGFVGHTSLLESGVEVVLGVITTINRRSRHSSLWR